MPQSASLGEDPESSMILLRLAQAGDRGAVDNLLARYLPRLERWAKGRLPAGVRTMNDTADLVQDAVINAMRNLNAMEILTKGALQDYLRKSIKNRIIDQYRRRARRPTSEEIPDDLPDTGRTPLERVIGAEARESYERSLGLLRKQDRTAIVLRVDLGLDYDELAVRLGRPSAAAARRAVTRAIERLAEAMQRADSDQPAPAVKAKRAR